MRMLVSKHKLFSNLIFCIVSLSFICLSSCEDVIDVNLKTDPPRLVVDATIHWDEKNSDGTQKIILTTNTDYYSATVPKATGAVVKVKNENQTEEYIFNENGATGVYICSFFKPIIGEKYTLTILYKGETYTASETMQSVTKVTKVTQKNDGGFLKDQYEVFFYFQDVPNVENYELVRFLPNYLKIPTLFVSDDRFNDGQEENWSYSDEDLKPGDTLEFTNYGISKQYYNYMNILINVAGGASGGGPFQTAPVSVKGNLINATNRDNYALGYFSLSESESIVYVVE